MDKDLSSRRQSLLDVKRIQCHVRRPRHIDYFGIPICSKNSTGASPGLKPNSQNHIDTFEIEVNIDNSESTVAKSSTTEAEKQPLILRDRVKSVAFRNADWMKACMSFGSATVIIEREPETVHDGDSNDEPSLMCENATEADSESNSAVSNLLNIKREAIEPKKVTNDVKRIQEKTDKKNKNAVETNTSNRSNRVVRTLNYSQEYDDRNDIDVDLGSYSPEAGFGNVLERRFIKTETRVENMTYEPTPDVETRQKGVTNEAEKDGDSRRNVGNTCNNEALGLKTNEEQIDSFKLNQKSAKERAIPSLFKFKKVMENDISSEDAKTFTENDTAGKEEENTCTKELNVELKTQQSCIAKRTNERDCMKGNSDGNRDHEESKGMLPADREVGPENSSTCSVNSNSDIEQHKQSKSEQSLEHAQGGVNKKTRNGKTKLSLDSEDHTPDRKRRNTGSEKSTILSPTSQSDKQSPLKNKVTYQIIKQRDMNESPVKKTYVCDICNMDIFKSKYDILTHKAEHHWF